MNAQDVTLGVALLGSLGTVSVQFINYLSTVHSKALDERQKQEDRKQELRKLFFTRKLEAGEIVVARVTLMINQLHQIHAYYGLTIIMNTIQLDLQKYMRSNDV